MAEKKTPIQHRYDIVAYMDVVNGNPNGDPDMGNMPRVDPMTGCGLITDVCIKRKLRNYVSTVKAGEDGYDIWVTRGKSLEGNVYSALDEHGIVDGGKSLKDRKTQLTKALKTEGGNNRVLRAVCDTYWDVRTFGGVVTTVSGCGGYGQLRGPVQVGIAMSVDPVEPQELTITRCCMSTEAEAQTKQGTMGNKWIVPYGLYRVVIHIDAIAAQRVTGFSEDDLQLLLHGLVNMWDYDHASGRGEMATRALIVAEHDNELGNQPGWQIDDAVTCKLKDGIDYPRSWHDYEGVAVDESAIAPGVTVTRLV